MQNVINTVKGTALGVAEFLTPVLKVNLWGWGASLLIGGGYSVNAILTRHRCCPGAEINMRRVFNWLNAIPSVCVYRIENCAITANAPAVFVHDRSRNSKRRESSRQRRSENSSNISLTVASLYVYIITTVVHTSSVCTSVCCSRRSLGSPLPNMEMVSAYHIQVTIKASHMSVLD